MLYPAFVRLFFSLLATSCRSRLSTFCVLLIVLLFSSSFNCVLLYDIHFKINK